MMNAAAERHLRGAGATDEQQQLVDEDRHEADVQQVPPRHGRPLQQSQRANPSGRRPDDTSEFRRPRAPPGPSPDGMDAHDVGARRARRPSRRPLLPNRARLAGRRARGAASEIPCARRRRPGDGRDRQTRRDAPALRNCAPAPSRSPGLGRRAAAAQDACPGGKRDTLAEFVEDFVHHVVIVRLAIHLARTPARVHQDQRRATPGDDLAERRFIAQAADVVDDRRARRQRRIRDRRPCRYPPRSGR